MSTNAENMMMIGAVVAENDIWWNMPMFCHLIQKGAILILS